MGLTMINDLCIRDVFDALIVLFIVVLIYINNSND